MLHVRPALLCACLSLLPSVARSQDKPPDAKPKTRITLETYLGGGLPNFSGASVSANWLDGSHWLERSPGEGLRRVDARTGESEPFVDSDALARALDALPAFDTDDARSLARLSGLRLTAGHGSLFSPRSQTSPLLSPDRKAVVFVHQGDLYYATLDGQSAVRLTSTPGVEEFPDFSPDGAFVAFVRDNDLHVVDVATHSELALTTGGSDLVRHGKADWVYYEEIFSRNWKTFWWSPDSRHLAFLECDDRPIGSHVVLNDIRSPRAVESTPYPKSGEPNPHVRLGIVPAAGGSVAWADLSDYTRDSFLISGVGWFGDGRSAYAYAQNRTQTWLDLLKVGIDGETKRLFRDATAAWIENPGDVHTLRDGSFLFPSERTGWKHLYRYSADGSKCEPLTSGEWEIRSVDLVDEAGGWVYFSATKDAPIAANLYRIKLDGGEPVRLTPEKGEHEVKVSPDGTLFLDTWSNRETPPRVVLRESDGDTVRTVAEDAIPALSSYDLAPSQRVTIAARDGFPLEGELTLPHDLDSKKKYPVWFMTYGGPHMPTVTDGWPAHRGLDQALASAGIVAFRVDPRSASGKGATSAHTAYKQLGVRELRDIEDAIEWLKKEHPFVDGDRIGMAGHSYGGYMTAYALTHSKLFAAGIAGAPVTDWRDYDSIYTERFMLTPQENPEGYDAGSVVRGASNLHGRLLLLHGAIDDNVSLRNTMRFVNALQLANKDFELMLYPSARHGIYGAHYTRLQIDFIRRALGGPRDQTATAAD